MPKRPDQPPTKDAAPDADAIPELEDVVETPGDVTEGTAAPPPNYDLFGARDIDLAALHDALMGRLNDEIDVVVAELHVALEETVRRHFEVRLRERLPAILEDVLKREAGEPD